MKLIKAYKSNITLMASVVAGGAVGLIAGPKASVLEPFGDIFINLIFMIIVPLVFFSAASAAANMKGAKRFARIILGMVVVFTATALIASVIGLAGAIISNPVEGINYETIQRVVPVTSGDAAKPEQVNLIKQLVNTITVSDFSSLLSRKNMLQIIVFSLLFGASAALVKEKGEPIARFLQSGSNVMLKAVDIIMYYAPIGLGCYFASVIGQLGGQILEGYFKVFILYLVLSIVYYFGFFTLYAFIAGGRHSVKAFWENASVPSLTALATCSSAACIPVNLEYVKKMGVPDDIAETVIPLGVNTHKDGSVIGGVLKIVFLFGIFGRDIKSLGAIASIIAVSYLVGAVMGAIPGGGMIGEMLIISIYGFPPEVLPMIAVISTIIDAPATLLNSTGNTVCSLMISRFVQGRQWITDRLSSIAKTA